MKVILTLNNAGSHPNKEELTIEELNSAYVDQEVLVRKKYYRRLLQYLLQSIRR